MTDIIISTEMPPSSASVVAALRLLGRWKAGTPLLMASTPVSAAQPDENARSSRKNPTALVRPSAYSGWTTVVKAALSASGRSPVSHRTRPVTAIPMMDAMKM